MCGILVEITTLDGSESVVISDLVRYRVARRGPDSLGTIIRRSQSHSVSFTSAVLHLRGSTVARQPIQDSKDVLCWNGEAWEGLSIDVTENDTEALFEALAQRPTEVAEVMSHLRGPYAFVYYQGDRQKIWFGTDCLGRRSLLCRDTDTGFVLSSVGDRHTLGWQVVSSNSIHCYDMTTRSTATYKWSHRPKDGELYRPYGYVNSEQEPRDERGRLPGPDKSEIENFRQVLLRAISIRTKTIPVQTYGGQHSSRIAVMYSGGVDCAVLARLLHDLIDANESVDLLNVSFENPRTIANAQKLDPAFDAIYDTPDRLTGRQGHRELQTRCPRDWRFIEVDVSYAEVQAAKEEVLDLMFPNDSVMDFSIALAFYFCARGVGTLQSSTYITRAKVFISGLGADEQLGGYSRHLAAYKSGGYGKLVEELQLDLDRIPTRNLGRDDRMLSHFGREVRWPFLDENVISYLSRLPVNQKMSLGEEGGDKQLLRKLGCSLGIPQASGEKKRAVQFGSRSARMEIEHGGDVKKRVLGHLQMR